MRYYSNLERPMLEIPCEFCGDYFYTHMEFGEHHHLCPQLKKVKEETDKQFFAWLKRAEILSRLEPAHLECVRCGEIYRDDRLHVCKKDIEDMATVDPTKANDTVTPAGPTPAVDAAAKNVASQLNTMLPGMSLADAAKLMKNLHILSGPGGIQWAMVTNGDDITYLMATPKA